MRAASVWITFSTIRIVDPERVGNERPSAETTPAVTDPAKPFGLPIATTSWPTWSRSASPSSAATTPLGSVRSTARSESGSAPTTSTVSSRPSTKEATPRSAPATTWAEVSRKPSGVMTTPLPPPSIRRPRAPRRDTRRFATDGASRRATSVTTRE